jgi:16S rRNA (adenine1518-N6/adenine1519-N6)-dimethyltransferase
LRRRLAARGLAPARSRGQNFLRSPELAQRLVEIAGIEPGDAVVEIGPGTGQLTRPLAAVARRTVALELDRGLVALLREQKWPGPVEIRECDALEADLGGIARELGPPVVLVGNLSYRIAGRLLARVLGPRNPFRRMAFMFQLEVARRALAAPGDPDFGPLAVWTRLWSRARLALELGPGAFEPRPRVRSAFVVFETRESEVAIACVGRLRDLVRTAFQHRRKTLRAALRSRVAGADRAMEALGIDPRRRPETLSEVEFARLANAIAERDRKET